MGAMELQIFVSLLVVLGAAFVALICDFLKGSNEKLREVNIELLVRQEERERAGAGRQLGQQPRVAQEPAGHEVSARPADIQPLVDWGVAPASVVEGLPAYPRRRRTARPADPQPIQQPTAVPRTPEAVPAPPVAQAVVEEWARSLVERSTAARTEDESPAEAAVTPVERIVQAPDQSPAEEQTPVVEAPPVETAASAFADAADHAQSIDAQECQPIAFEPAQEAAVSEQIGIVAGEVAPVEAAIEESAPPSECEPALNFGLQRIADPLPLEVPQSVAPVAVEAVFENVQRGGEASFEAAAHPATSFVADSATELMMCGPAGIETGAARPGLPPSGAPVEPIQAERKDGVEVELDVALPAERSVGEIAGLIDLELAAVPPGLVQPCLTHPAAILPTQVTILPESAHLATAPPDWGEQEYENAVLEVEAAEPEADLALPALDETAAEPGPETAAVPVDEAEVETSEPPVEEVVRVRVLDLGDFIDLSGTMETPLEPIGTVPESPRSRSLAPVYPFQVPQTGSLKRTSIALDETRLTHPADWLAATNAGSIETPERDRSDEIEPEGVDAVVSEIVHGAEDLEWPYGVDEDESEFAAQETYEESEPEPAVMEEAVAGEAVQAPAMAGATEGGSDAIAAEPSSFIEVEPGHLMGPPIDEIEPEAEYIAPLVNDEIAPVMARGEHYVDVENELEVSPKVVQMPTPVQAAESDLGRAVRPQIPRGIHDRQTLAGLLEEQIEFQGVVFFLGLLGYEHLIAEHGQASVRQSVDAANEYLESIMGDRGFGCWTEDAAFLMLLPAESSDEAREISRRTAEALWDYQLRSLGSLPLIFHWGCADADGDPLASVIETARDQMTESGRARKQVLSASGRFRRKVVNG